ncbi:MAG: protein kinase [Polyangiaceae bacterium]|nr:protein kinase [Polyangiaceae bacterium]
MTAGEVLGSYRVEGELGRGHLTVAWRATHLSTSRAAVVKRPREGAGAALVDPVRREARALGRLNHGNVPQLYEFVDGPAPWLARELVDGATARDLLRGAHGGVSVGAALSIGCALASALAHAHARGVHHGGGELSDVWLTREGVVKLSGFSRATGPALAELGEVPAQAERRSARCLSPEELLGEAPSQGSDVFVVGAWLFELLAGTHPFGGGEDDPSPPRARGGDAPRLGDLVEVPSLVERVIARAIAPELEERFPSATALYDALSQAARELSIEPDEEPVRRAMVVAGLSVLRPGAASAERASGRSPGLGRAAFGQLFVLAAMILGVSAIRATAPPSELEDSPEVLPLVPERAANLRVVARPWATVYVNGQLVDVTPFARPVPVRAGEHRLTFRHPSAPDERRVVRVTEGETALVEVEMRVPPRPPPAASSAPPAPPSP